MARNWSATSDEILAALRGLPAAQDPSRSDAKARYKRSRLGPFWLTLGAAIGVDGLGFAWNTLFKMDRAEFIPLLTAGLILWQFIAGVITESTTVFVASAQLIPCRGHGAAVMRLMGLLCAPPLWERL